jgi:hypothetical protein
MSQMAHEPPWNVSEGAYLLGAMCVHTADIIASMWAREWA